MWYYEIHPVCPNSACFLCSSLLLCQLCEKALTISLHSQRMHFVFCPLSLVILSEPKMLPSLSSFFFLLRITGLMLGFPSWLLFLTSKLSTRSQSHVMWQRHIQKSYHLSPPKTKLEKVQVGLAICEIGTSHISYQHLILLHETWTYFL